MQGELTLQGAGKRRGAGSMVWALHTVYFSSSVRGSATPALQRSTMFTFQPQRTLVQTQSECTQWGRPRIQRSQRSSKPSNAPCRATSLSPSSCPTASLQSCVSSMKTFTCIDMQRESLCGAQRWQCKQARKQAATAMAARVSNLGNAKCQPQVPHPHYSKKGRAGQINARIAHKLRTGTAAGGPQMVGTHTTQNTLQQQEQNGGEESEKEVKKPE